MHHPVRAEDAEHVAHRRGEIPHPLGPRFVENRFGLAHLSASDTRANSPEDYAFNWGSPPRKFQVIPAKYSKDYFLDQPADLRPPDNQ